MGSFIVFCARYLFAFVIIGLIVARLLTNKEDKKRFIVLTIIAGIVAFILAEIGGHLHFYPRPFVTEHAAPLFPDAANYGFPSDHTLLNITLTAVIYFFSKKIAAAMLVLTVAVCIAYRRTSESRNRGG